MTDAPTDVRQLAGGFAVWRQRSRRGGAAAESMPACGAAAGRGAADGRRRGGSGSLVMLSWEGLRVTGGPRLDGGLSYSIICSTYYTYTIHTVRAN